MNPGVIFIGSLKWPPVRGCGPAVVEIEGGVKLDKKESDGKDDARVTVKGRQAGDVKITLTWKEDNGPIEAAAKAYLIAISPRGPASGQPQEFIHADAEINNVDKIVVEKLKTKRVAGSGQGGAEITASSWSKPTATANGAGAGKTPANATPGGEDGKKGADGQVANAFSTVSGGASSDGFKGPNAPTVDP